MKKTTLVFLRDGDRLLLAMKKRGFGAGKWNGVGGKVEQGESCEDAAIREAAEEIAVEIAREKLKRVGTIKFYFTDQDGWDQECSVYIVEQWRGDPQESEEMKPHWYPIDEIPYTAMWVDDVHWLPRLLAGQEVDAEFYFDNGGATIAKQSIREIM